MSVGVKSLSVELQGTVEFTQYRAALADAAGQTVWRAAQLRPTSPEALGIGLSARLMAPGDYVLTLEGVGLGAHSASPGRAPGVVSTLNQYGGEPPVIAPAGSDSAKMGRKGI